MIDIVAATLDPNLFEPWFPGSSWEPWRTVLRAAFALPMSENDKAFLRSVADRDPPAKRPRELWAVAGRRAGKDSVASLIVTYAAALFDDASRLRPGERPLCLLLAVDREQAKICLSYIRAFFERIPPLAVMVTRETKDGFELSNGIDIYVGTNDFRGVRGRTILSAVFDEVAFWRSDESAAPDVETYRAALPGMATLPNSMLIGISSPYKRSGLLYDKFKKSYGENDDAVLVIKAPSRTLNPSLDPKIVEDAIASDPAAARAEWLAEFRDDVAGFLTAELIEGAVDLGVVVRPRAEGVRYFAFADAASGTGKDSFTLGVAHLEDEVAVLDLAHEVRPPFNAQNAVAECAELIKAYGLSEVHGDRYAPGFVSEAFARHGVQYRYSDKDRSQIYLEVLPAFTSGRVRLIDNRRLAAQFAGLERRPSTTGRDRVDHAKDAHDDIANAAAGALTLAAASARTQMKIVSPVIIPVLSRGGPFAAGPNPFRDDTADQARAYADQRNEGFTVRRF